MKIMITPDKAVPKGVQCQECGRVARPGQAIFCEKITDVGFFLWHKDCLTTAIRNAPDDLDTTVSAVYNDPNVPNDIQRMMDKV